MDILEQLDIASIEREMSRILPESTVSFQEIFNQLISGDTEMSFSLIWEMIQELLFQNLATYKSGMIHILILMLIAAVFTNFSNVFQNKQVAEISFFVIYLLLITMTIGTFQALMTSVSNSVENLVSFIKVIGPVYLIATSIATGSVTSVGFYSILILIILLVQIVITGVLIPMVQILVVLRVLNHLSAEDYLSKFAEFLETLIVWASKSILAVVIGLNVVQGILGPGVDLLKRNAVKKGAEALPGVGDALGGATEMVAGTAVVIKNGIGMGGAIVCVLLVLGPLIQVAVMCLIYKFTAAVAQPISDKRVVGCITSVADGAAILLRLVYTTGILFLITIAIVATTAGG